MKLDEIIKDAPFVCPSCRWSQICPHGDGLANKVSFFFDLAKQTVTWICYKCGYRWRSK